MDRMCSCKCRTMNHEGFFAPNFRETQTAEARTGIAQKARCEGGRKAEEADGLVLRAAGGAYLAGDPAERDDGPVHGCGRRSRDGEVFQAAVYQDGLGA